MGVEVFRGGEGAEVLTNDFGMEKRFGFYGHLRDVLKALEGGRCKDLRRVEQ